MTQAWVTVPVPLFQGGENPSSAPGVSALQNRVENGLLTGSGVVEQVPDWLVAATCTDGATENDAVCGIFPFATQGGASAASAGVAFSFDTSANKLWLHQLGEDGSILRTIQAYTGYTESAPPQMTGFEMFGKFYVCPYGREAAASRLGMGVFDPTGAGTFTIPTYDLSAGGTAAAALRFRGIAKHRGGTILGWGYLNEESGNVDQPQTVRYSKYVTPDTWVADSSVTSAGFFNLGTLNLPVIAAAASGQYTVLAKETEIFALDGDYGAQLYVRQIGAAHGPQSTAGMASTGPMAVWITRDGYVAASVNGGDVQLIGPDRIQRRRLTMMDLAYAGAVHDAPRTRVGFLVRLKSTLQGAPLSYNWPTQILWWDYARDAFHVQGAPTTCFSIGTIAGPGITFAGPSGTPDTLAATVSAASASLSWGNGTGDPSAQTSIEYRVDGTTTYLVVGPSAVGATSWLLTGLSPSTTYNWRLRYVKNGQYSSYATGSNFTTSAGSACGTPTNLASAFSSSYSYGGKTYGVYSLSWTRGEFAAGSMTDLYEGTTATFADASLIASWASAKVGTTVEEEVTSPALVRYYWVRHRLADGTAGTEAGPETITFEGAA